MDLYLVRHGAAADAADPQWPNDRDRPLTPQGVKRFRREARGLALLGAGVVVMLSSPYSRAWRTAELLAEDAGWPAPIECAALEPGRPPAEVLAALQPYSSSSAVALVGHEPSMHQLASYLLTSDTQHAAIEFRKGSVARLELVDGLRPGSAVLLWLLAPKVLRAISPS
jgi:phosphohistidine phosphatase